MRLATGGMGIATGGLAGAHATSSILVNLVRLVIFGLGALVILQSQGISITPVLTALGVGGLAVALALQDPLSNLFAGLQILSAKKVRIGNSIRLDSGDEGTVTDIAWRYTTVVTGLNNTVLVPNAKLASAIVTNYSMPDHEVVVNVAVGVDYGSDLEHVERVSLEVAREVQARDRQRGARPRSGAALQRLRRLGDHRDGLAARQGLHRPERGAPRLHQAPARALPQRRHRHPVPADRRAPAAAAGRTVKR